MEDRTEKFAFLISAYTEPQSLYVLVKKLNEMLDADFYIHIDKKVKIEPFYFDLASMPNVSFVRERIKVFWGGYSQVEMQISLIREMLNQNIRYSRVINLTGTDYPIVSRKILYEKLNQSEIEYICGFDVCSELRTGKKRMIHKYDRFYLMDTPKMIRALVKRLKIPRIEFRRHPIPMYYGSEYWALSFDCLSDLFEAYLKDEQLQKLLRFSFVPSEAWIQTMFFNSRWRGRAVRSPEECDDDLIHLSPITYFKYGDSIKILNESDYEDIVSSGRLFARKIVKGRSDRLVSMLAENRNIK